MGGVAAVGHEHAFSECAFALRGVPWTCACCHDNPEEAETQLLGTRHAKRGKAGGT
jgi:hypothetical protein